MYARWKRRKLAPGWRGQDRGYALDAVLVASERVAGRVRQRFICHLGRIIESRLDRPLARARFWASVRGRLCSAYTVSGNAYRVDDATRARIETTLSVRVAIPTAEEIAAAEAELRALLTRATMSRP